MRTASISFVLIALGLALAPRAHCAAASPIRIELDATQAPIGLLHSHMTIPATAGTLTLAYPKWIPGEHSPGGPLSQVVRLSFSANGKPLDLEPRRPGYLRVPCRGAAGSPRRYRRISTSHVC